MPFTPVSHRAHSTRPPQGPEDASVQPGYRAITDWLLGHPSAVFAALFVAVYGVVRTAAAEFYNALGLAPEDVGLTQVRLVASAGFLIALLLALTLMMCLTGLLVWGISHDQAGPQMSWIRVLLVVFIPSLLIHQATAFISGFLGVWLQMAGISAVLVAATAAINTMASRFEHEDYRKSISTLKRWLLPSGQSRVRLSVVLVALFLILVPPPLATLIGNEGGEGMRLLRVGTLPESFLASTTYPVFPARVVALADDPLGICDGSRVATLVGRDGGRSYVLLRAPTNGDPAAAAPGEVMPLSDADYSVVTGVDRPLPCTRRAAAPGFTP